MKRLILLSAALILTAGDHAFAQDAPPTRPAFDENADGIADGRARQHRGRGFRGSRGLGANLDLTDEQRQAIRATVEGLRAEGAEREDIRSAVDEQLTGFGIDIEAVRAEADAARQEQRAQREAARELIGQLKEDGASRDEIKAALEEQGFEPPQRRARGRGHGRGFGRGAAPADAPAPESAE